MPIQECAIVGNRLKKILYKMLKFHIFSLPSTFRIVFFSEGKNKPSNGLAGKNWNIRHCINRYCFQYLMAHSFHPWRRSKWSVKWVRIGIFNFVDETNQIPKTFDKPYDIISIALRYSNSGLLNENNFK